MTRALDFFWRPFLRFLLSVGAFALFFGVSFHAQARTYVVAIGNNRGYRHESELLFAERDAGQFMGVMQRYSSAQARDTILLQGRAASEIIGTLHRIRQEIERLPAAQRLNTKLIVYYSGHADGTSLHPGHTSISYQKLRRLLQQVPVQVRVLIVDGCRSGGLTRVKGATKAKPFDITTDNKLESSGFVMISSSTATEDSHESDRLRGSFFTHHFLNALRGIADFNDDGSVSLHESFSYAYHQTLRSSSSTLSLQHPTLETRLRGKGDLVVSTPRIAENETSRVILGSPATYLVQEDKKHGTVVAELQTYREGQILRLPPGDYQIQRRGPMEYRNYHVQLKNGRTVELARQQADVLAYEELVRRGGPRPMSNTLQVHAGIRGPLAHQSKVSTQISLGYTLHLKHLSLSASARFGFGSFRHRPPHRALQTKEREVGLRLSIEKYVDLKRLSLGFGLWSEGLYFQQRTHGQAAQARRHSFATAFGGSFALLLPLTQRLGARFEAGPVTYVLRRSKLSDGVEGKAFISTPVTGFAQLGAYLRF